jgi:hypothetical protein
MSLILKADPTDKTPNHFIVLYAGVQVGRIFDRVRGASAPHYATWCWTIEAKHCRDRMSAGGSSATSQDAMAAFRKAWDAR